ncbi:nucleotidyltransferase family protein [Albidovulum sp.]|jgi:molybdenum cofactor cytidylyltransferase|uniref:nucleotidyltransferase family protein n=1 Tax=Albidovulum sp. TaxID=1872424 RepID=UPI0039B8B129
MTELVVLIPAAGASRRMEGADKLLEEIDGEPVLRRTARTAGAAGGTVLVALPETGPYLAARRATLTGLGVHLLPVPDAHEGMAASLRAGAREIGPAEGLMVLLPDMPDIGADDIRRLVAAFAEDTTRPVRATTEDGAEAGHPVILPRRLMQELGILTGDRGARIVLEGENVRLVPLPGRRAVTDLDTPEDWAAWRAARGG